MSSTKEIIDQAMALSEQERSVVVEQLLLSLDAPDSALDRVWADEAEARLDAYERGDLKTVAVQDVLMKYDKK